MRADPRRASDERGRQGGPSAENLRWHLEDVEKEVRLFRGQSVKSLDKIRGGLIVGLDAISPDGEGVLRQGPCDRLGESAAFAY